MLQTLCHVWLPRLLYWGCLTLAGLLAALVAVAPWLAGVWDTPVLDLFADDSVVRRTSLVSALGLVLTAVLFFRNAVTRTTVTHRGPPPPMAGA